MATHRLESELGVDQRFTRGIDKQGSGRYVPEDVRSHVYDALPDSLDKVRAGTDAPVEIFNRKGQKLYDSRLDARSPGEVLSQARDARVVGLKMTRSLSENWSAQQAWHEDVPGSLQHNPRMTEPTAQNLLHERGTLNVVEGASRGTSEAGLVYEVAKQRSGGLGVRGLGVVGAAAVLHDASTTYHRAADLFDAHNRVGGRSEILRFGSRNLGMFAGAELGAATGAALGVESGPGLFVTGAIGGVAGAIGGEKIANAIDSYRIYNQDDGQGQRWHYDARHPDKGWTREELTGEVGYASNAPVYGYGVMPSPQTRTVHAAPALANELSFKASNQATQLALSHAGASDPFTLPASATDSAHFSAGPWTRDPETHGWSHMVLVGRIAQHMRASPDRAAGLDRQAEAVIAQNAANTPQAIAAHYKATYARNNWQQFGPVPEAVSHARHEPTHSLTASDGDKYARNAGGQWETPGLIYGTKAANGNIRDELDPTSQAQKALLQHAREQERMTDKQALHEFSSAAQPHGSARPAETARSAPIAAPITRHSSTSDMFDALISATAHRDVDGMRAVGQAYLASDQGQAWLQAGRDFNQQAQAQQAAHDAQAEQPSHDASAMTR